MKKGILVIASIGLLFSCGGATEDQKKAASDMCDCMDKDMFGDDDINYYECDLEIGENYPAETFTDGWDGALEDGCPSVAGMLKDGNE